MKYRIKQIGSRFYPQQRMFFMWFCMEQGSVYGGYDTWFDNVEDTTNFIKNRIAQKSKKIEQKIHKLEI